LFIESLLELKISPHVSDLSVPEIELIPLDMVILLHLSNLLLYIISLFFLIPDGLLKLLYSGLKSALIGLKSNSEGFSPLSFLLGL